MNIMPIQPGSNRINLLTTTCNHSGKRMSFNAKHPLLGCITMPPDNNICIYTQRNRI